MKRKKNNMHKRLNLFTKAMVYEHIESRLTKKTRCRFLRTLPGSELIKESLLEYAANMAKKWHIEIVFFCKVDDEEIFVGSEIVTDNVKLSEIADYIKATQEDITAEINDINGAILNHGWFATDSTSKYNKSDLLAKFQDALK